MRERRKRFEKVVRRDCECWGGFTPCDMCNDIVDGILALLDDSEPVSWAYWAASGASLTDSPAEAQMWRDAGYNVVSLYTSPTPTKPEGGEG